MSKKLFIAMLLSAAFILTGSSAFADDITGLWANRADSGKNKGQIVSHIKIWESNGIYYAKIVKLLKEKPDALCTACKGAKKNKPIVGMTFVWGMKKKGNAYSGGKIMDPENGNTYTCRMWSIKKGKVLKVRGYVAFFYRTQYWYKMK